MRKKQNHNRQNSRQNGYERSSHKADTMSLPKLSDIEPPKNYYGNNESPISQQRKNNLSQKRRNKLNNRSSQSVKMPPAQYKNRQEQRRAENARRKKKKAIKKFIVYSASVISVIVISVIIFYTVLFKITDIKIEKNRIYTDAQILNSIDVQKGDNLYAINKKKLGEYMVETFPYVRNVEIQRKFPNELIITVNEDKPTYVYKDENKYILLNDKLKVLEVNVKEEPKKTALISGVKFNNLTPGQVVSFTDTKTEKRVEIMLDAVQKSDLKPITQINMKSSANNSIMYDNRILIKLGSIDDLEYILKFAGKSIDELNKENPNVKGKLDMTVDKYGYFTAEE